MKRRVYLAVLASCAALAMAGCGQDTVKKDDKTATQSDKAEDADEGVIDEEEADNMGGEDETDTEDADSEASGQEENSLPERLVSVDKLEDYLKLGQYKGVEVDQVSIMVSDEDIDASVKESLGAGEEVSGAEVQEGDTVTIDYVGTRDGEEFEGGSAEAYDLKIGSGQFIPGFEDGLIGAKKGETRSLDLTFPEDYGEGRTDGAAEMAGVAVNFQVTVQKIRRPELTDEWAAANTDYKTAKEYRAAVGEQLQELADASASDTMKAAAWQKVLVDSEVLEYPEKDVDAIKDEFREEIQMYADQNGMEFDEFLESQEMTEEQFEEQAGEYAKIKVKQNLIVQAIMDAEGISLDDEECQAILQRMVTYYGTEDVSGLAEQYGEQVVAESVGLERVKELLLENAVLTEPASEENTQDTEAESDAAEEADAPADEGAAEDSPEAETPVDEEA